MRIKKIKIGVIGLGYVGLPLFVKFSQKYDTLGFDINKKKILDLKKNKDIILKLKKKEFRYISNKITFNIENLKDCNILIVTVPTPVNKNKDPDLNPLKNACLLISKIIKHKDIVIFESTSFPGTTEEICAKIIEKKSLINYVKNDVYEKVLKKKNKEYFYCGYSPERINPGDGTHTLENIVKVVSASTKKTLNFVNNLYLSIIRAGTYKAESIKVAEAAKIIENTQRDINIALFNELSIIFNKLNLNTKSIIDAASTKWNFHKYEPGLVGGHCISTDPYYLTYISKKNKYSPKIILSGRKLNDGMSKWVLKNILRILNKKTPKKKIKVLMLGLTFKENCPDTRNSQLIQLSEMLIKKNMNISVFDPYIKTKSDGEINKKIVLLRNLPKQKGKFDIIIIGIKHNLFKKIKVNYLNKIKKKDGFIIDLKNLIPKRFSDFQL